MTFESWLRAERSKPPPPVAGDAETPEPPTRVDAGAGGTATNGSIPLSGIALAGGLVIVTGAAALKMHRELRT